MYFVIAGDLVTNILTQRRKNISILVFQGDPESFFHLLNAKISKRELLGNKLPSLPAPM